MEYCDCGAPLDFSPDGAHCVGCFEAIERLGPFQRKARNMGLDRAIVRRLPPDWPSCRFDWSRIEDALFEAGYPPGEELLRVARGLWEERPWWYRGHSVRREC
jgi:hypothetical protein